MIQSFSRAVAQLPDPKILKIIFQVIATTIGLIFAITFLSYLGLSYLGSLEDVRNIIPFVELPAWIFESLTLGVLVVLFIFFPALSTIAAGLFLDKVADVVEGKYYPKLSPVQEMPLSSVIWMAVKLLTLTLVLNILVLPLYFIPLINLVVFYVLNGYLIGREYYEMVAQRHLPVGEIRSFRKTKMGGYLIFGAIVTFLLTIPFLNLLMPIIATAAMVHLFHKAREKAA